MVAVSVVNRLHGSGLNGKTDCTLSLPCSGSGWDCGESTEFGVGRGGAADSVDTLHVGLIIVCIGELTMGLRDEPAGIIPAIRLKLQEHRVSTASVCTLCLYGAYGDSPLCPGSL